MGKFSDSPYFFIDHYLEAINVQIQEDIKSKVISLWPVIFTDIDNIIFQDYKNIEWNFDEYETIEGSYSKKQVDYTYQASYLTGQNKGIVAIGDRIIQLFVKDDDYGFREIYVTPPWNNYKNGNFFNFYKHITLPYQYGSTLTETITGSSYRFDVYAPIVQFDPEDINNKEVYFRKDSQFHSWLLTYARQHFIDIWDEEFIIRNYVNTDKQFLYFGKIYHKSGDDYHIEFYGMKDFVEKAIPEFQRTERLKEFINVEFDRVYQEIYSLLKNIWSLIDPYEVDEKFLGYLGKFYNINIDKYKIDILNQREFIRELIYYLKRKGSYSSFYAVWKVLTEGTVNNLKIYEKWISRDFSTYTVSGDRISPNDSDFKSVLYTDQYTTFPLSGSSNDYILTPYYTVQMDLSTEPMEYNKISSYEMLTGLVEQWEKLRPVNKVAEYEILLTPELNLTSNKSYLYSSNTDKYTINFSSEIKKFIVSLDDAYVHIFGGGYTSLLVEHNLTSSHLFVRCYDMTFNEVVPDEILFINDESIRVNFSEPFDGFILVKKPDLTILQLSQSLSPWIIKHQFLQKQIYVEFNQSEEKVYVDNLTLINDEFIETDINGGAVNISKPNFIFFQVDQNNEWYIEHNLGYKGILISCFDINNNEIIPSEIELITTNSCKLTFSENVSGYAVIISVGNPLFADMIIEKVGDEYLLPYFETSSVIDNFQTSDYKSRISSIHETNDSIYLTIEIPKNVELSIKEIKIYDSSDNILIYTECGEIFKPMNIKMKIEYKVNKYITKGSL